MINGEKAAFNTPIFSQKRERTLDMLIRDMYADVMTEHRGVSLVFSVFSSVTARRRVTSFARAAYRLRQ